MSPDLPNYKLSDPLPPDKADEVFRTVHLLPMDQQSEFVSATVQRDVDDEALGKTLLGLDPQGLNFSRVTLESIGSIAYLGLYARSAYVRAKARVLLRAFTAWRMSQP